MKMPVAQFSSTKGATSYQPGATPQEQCPTSRQGLKARAIPRADGPGFQPLGNCETVTQGIALGDVSQKSSPALKGRHNSASADRWSGRADCSAPSGRENHWAIQPGALPRAITFRPFRAAETQRLAALYTRKLAGLEALKKSLLHQAFTGAL